MRSADRPISTVLHDIVGNIQDIVRSEMRMAKTELGEELGKSRSAAVLLGVGVLLSMLSVAFVLLAIVYALSQVIAGWAAALIVGATVGLFAALCCNLGIRKFKAMRAAPKTAESLKEDLAWAKQLTR
jgi:uncharacterized membrane protein YqjE